MVREHERLARPAMEMLRTVYPALEANRALLDRLNVHAQQQRLLEELAPARKMFDELQRTFAPMASMLKDLTAPMARLQEMLGKEFGSLESATRIWSDINPALASDWRALVQQHLQDFDPGEISVDAAGDVSVGHQTMGASEFKATVEEFAKEAASATGSAQSLSRVSAFLARVPAWLGKILLFLLLHHFFPVFDNLMTPLYEPWWRQFVDGNEKQVRQEIPRLASEDYPLLILQDYRFVRVKELIVRTAPSKRSGVVATLPLAKVVRFTGYKGAWARVQFEDDPSGDLRTGWVFQRYLASFNR